MSYESTKAVNLPAGEDLRGNVFHLVKLVNSSGKAVVQKTTAATDLGIGIVAEEPRKDVASTGENVPVTITFRLSITEPPPPPPPPAPVRMSGYLLERGTRRPLADVPVSARAGEPTATVASATRSVESICS